MSGLVFSGANRMFNRDATPWPTSQQGILTAEAIAARHPDHLRLAVLSACETGLGEVAGGESVYGLTRAFHMAGCDNVVATLWKVDDAASAALMELFYRGLLEKHKKPLSALRASTDVNVRRTGEFADLHQDRSRQLQSIACRLRAQGWCGRGGIPHC